MLVPPTQADLQIRDSDQVPRGLFRIGLLPNTGATAVAPLVIDPPLEDPDSFLERVQLLEDSEYSYMVELGATGAVRLEPTEIFSPDRDDMRSGRLRTHSFVGLLTVQVWVDQAQWGEVRLEVRSRKLNYLRHYRWMLRDLTDLATGILLDRFAPTSQRFRPNEARSSETAYQKFTLLGSLLWDSGLLAAFEQIRSRPHVAWQIEEELRLPQRGLKAGRSGVLELIRSGPRVKWLNSYINGLPTLPRTITVDRPVETLDTVPNRFIKFALRRWIALLVALRRSLEQSPDSAPKRRGVLEVGACLDVLTAMFSEPILRDVGELTQLPTSNQVLLKREGYRDFLRAYIQVEGAAQLTWQGGEEIFHAGQRDLATLYEFWVFIELFKVVRGLCRTLDGAPLLELSEEGVNLALKAGKECRLSGSTEYLGRAIRVDLFYNRAFRKHDQASWTVSMRPDCSVRFSAVDASDGFESVWLHFDAKYRVDCIEEIVGDDEQVGTGLGMAAQGPGQAKRDDLLKMHAYRDAIRRSVGSYVLYPGVTGNEDESKEFKEYHEILPGLGAFALLPSDDGAPIGIGVLRRFLNDAIEHFASVISQDRRGRYWQGVSFERGSQPLLRSGWDPGVKKPPADTPTLLGYVRTDRQLDWIHRNRRYNLRVGTRRGSVGLTGPEIGSEIVVLYGPPLELPEVWIVGGEPEVWPRDRMLATGYLDPGGDLYLCLPLDRVVENSGRKLMTTRRVQLEKNRVSPHSPLGAPAVSNWLRLLGW